MLGPIPRDQIVPHAGERFEKYGCVLYTAVALSALLDDGDTIVPISHVRRQDEGPIKEILGSFPNIDTSGITSPADQGDIIELRYIEHNRRVERQTSFMNPFAAGLAYGYLAYRDYVVACQYGNAMGAQRCTGADLNVYLSREETERQILAAYGPRS